jgi:MFS family permease
VPRRNRRPQKRDPLNPRAPEPGTAGIPFFTRYWLGDTGAVLAYQMLVVAVGWQVYDLTNSAMSLGLIGLAQFLPQFLLALVVGQVADRYDRRRVSVICMVVQCVLAALMAAGSYSGRLSSEAIYVCAFCIGAAQAFQSPTMKSMLPTLVGENRLAKYIAWSTGARKGAVVIGPALGGFVYLLGVDAVYAFSAIVFLVAGILIAGIRLPSNVIAFQRVTLKFMFGGIHYIRGNRLVLGAISMDLFATLLGGATALLPIYARDILQTGPWGLGILRSAPAVGALLMSVYLVRRPLKRHVGRTLMVSVAAFGAATVVFGLSTSLPLSLAALMALGAADMISMVIRASLVQLETPDAMRGRVNAVNSLFTGTSNQLGQFESGVTAALFGTVPSVVIGGIGALLVVALWMRLFPGLARRDVLRE